MDEDLEKIKCLKKITLKNVLDNKIKEKVFEELNLLKESHSKVKHLKHYVFEMQKYFKPCNIKITKEEAQEIFKLRSRVSDVKLNYKGKYETYECQVCKKEDESQEHIIVKCKSLNKSKEEMIKYEDIFEGNVIKRKNCKKVYGKHKTQKKN